MSSDSLLTRPLTPEERIQIKDQLRLIQQQVESQSNQQSAKGFIDTMFQFVGGGVIIGWSLASFGAFYRSPAPFRFSYLSMYRRPEAITACANLGAMFGVFSYIANQMGYSSGSKNIDPIKFRHVLPDSSMPDSSLEMSEKSKAAPSLSNE